jgi:hypothetical protein
MMVSSIVAVPVVGTYDGAAAPAPREAAVTARHTPGVEIRGTATERATTHMAATAPAEAAHMTAAAAKASSAAPTHTAAATSTAPTHVRSTAASPTSSAATHVSRFSNTAAERQEQSRCRRDDDFCIH